MYKILASALAILLSTQMVVPLAFAADQPEAKTGTTLQNAGVSELSGETTSRTASLTTLGAAEGATAATPKMCIRDRHQHRGCVAGQC